MKRLVLFLSVAMLFVLAACNTNKPKDLTTEQKLKQVYNDLTILDNLKSVKHDLILITEGEYNATITWESDKPEVVSNTGKVSRPAHGDGNVEVTLTATIMIDGKSRTKSFNLIIIEELPEYVYEDPTIPVMEPCPEEFKATTKYEIDNYSFESGNYCGWLVEGEQFHPGHINSESFNWSGVDYEPIGNYHFNLWTDGTPGEELKGSLTSSQFEIGGTGWITFRIGAGKNTDLIYISIIDENGKEIARFGNTLFNDSPQLFTYKADLSAHIGKKARIKIVDNATSDWAFLMFDHFVTYYENEENLPEDAEVAINLLLDDHEAPVIRVSDQIVEVGSTINWNDVITVTDNKDTDLFIEIDDTEVDFEIVGSYTVTVTAKDLSNNTSQESFTVNVVDTTRPIITGTRNYTVVIGSTIDYLKGVSVTDNYDESVEIILDDSEVDLETVGAYTVIYKAKDSSGNETTVEKVIKVVEEITDKTPPVFEGLRDLVIENGETVNYLHGVLVTDETDEEVYVTVDDSNVNLETPGTYELIYIAEDSSGNKVIEKVTVTVVNFQVDNGDFRTGDFTDWTIEGEAFSDLGLKWIEEEGIYRFDTFYQQYDMGGAGESATGKLISNPFILSGSGFITFRLAGGKNTELMYISIKTIAGEEIARYGNELFDDNFDLTLYKADLSKFIGESLVIEVVDNATEDWGWYNFDSIITYYESESNLPEDANLATNLIAVKETE